MWGLRSPKAAWIMTVVTSGPLAIHVQTVDAQCEMDRLITGDADFDDRFGVAVEVSGDYAVAGAFLDDEAGSDAGAAYVFRRQGTRWIQQQKLMASDAAVEDHFGTDVAISGDYLIVAAVRNDDNGMSSGSAYVFRRDGATWIEQAKLTASDASSGDEFGFALDIDGDCIVVSAIADTDDGPNAGAVYVFRRAGDDWVEEIKLTADDAAPDDDFGAGVSISGDHLVVGARRDDDRGSDSGSAYIFRHQHGTWIQEAKITASDGASGDWFGEAVSISRDVVLVGVGYHGPNDSGAAYIFRHESDKWVEEEILVPLDTHSTDRFGTSVAVNGDIALVGSPEDDDVGSASGSAYFFTFSPTAGLWLEGPKLTASDGGEGDRFGARVDFDGSSAMGGAQFSDQGANQTGSAYIFTGLVAIDCNMNGTNDACDIVDGSSEDSNDNGVPDECECPWDLDDNGSVGASDLLSLLVSWGPCKGCPADFDGNGSVGASDLLALLVNWGPCP